MSETDRSFSIPYSIGCDIGVTNVKTVCVSRTGTVLARCMAPTNATSADWPAGVRARLAQLELQYGVARSIGIAAPGIAHPYDPYISWMQGRLDRIQGLNWTEHLGRAHEVPVLNDAQAALLGEVWQGAARGARNAAMLTLGTGVGGALLVDGRLLRGAIGRAGHLGHLSLDIDGPPDITNCPGSLEQAIGNVTVAARSGGRFATTHDLISAHASGDTDATAVWLRSVRALAGAAASIINVADPEVLIIGGGIAGAGDALFGPLRDHLDRYEWRPNGHRVRVVPAVLGEYAGALGAAWNGITQAGDSENAWS